MSLRRAVWAPSSPPFNEDRANAHGTVFPSEMAAAMIGDGKLIRDYVPAGRVGTDEDMAGTVLYLTSRAGAFCNGNVVVIDGGTLSLLPATY